MASIKVLSLSDLLTNIDRLEEDEECAIYMPKSESWTLDTFSTVICDDDDDNDDVDNDQYAKQHDLKYVLGMPTFCDIVNNAKLQKPKISIEDLLRAFNFYYENDAFIDFGVKP